MTNSPRKSDSYWPHLMLWSHATTFFSSQALYPTSQRHVLIQPYSNCLDHLPDTEVFILSVRKLGLCRTSESKSLGYFSRRRGSRCIGVQVRWRGLSCGHAHWCRVLRFRSQHGGGGLFEGQSLYLIPISSFFCPFWLWGWVVGKWSLIAKALPPPAGKSPVALVIDERVSWEG